MPLCLGTSEKEKGGWNVQLVETPTDEKSLSLQTDLGIKKTLHNNSQREIWRNLIDHFHIKQEKNYQGDAKLSSQGRGNLDTNWLKIHCTLRHTGPAMVCCPSMGPFTS